MSNIYLIMLQRKTRQRTVDMLYMKSSYFEACVFIHNFDALVT